MPDSHADDQISKLENGITPLQLFDMLWGQKVVILFAILVFLAGALADIFLTTPLYEVKMQIRPGITQYEDGFKKPGRSWTVDDLITWINSQYYRSLFSSDGHEEAALRSIRGTKAAGAQMVTLSLLAADPKAGQAVLDRIMTAWVQHYVSQGNDQSIAAAKLSLQQAIQSLDDQKRQVDEVEEKNLELNIKEWQRKVRVQEEEIILVRERRQANEKALQQFEQQEAAAIANTSQLVALRNDFVAKGKTQDLAFIMYSNIVQQNASYMTQLQERITNLQKNLLADRQVELSLQKMIGDSVQEIEQLKITKEETLPTKRRKLQREIDDLQEKINTLAPVEKVSGPTASENPVSPKKSKVFTVAVVSGGLLGVCLAFLRAMWQARGIKAKA
jgi:capsular polysaccharide biosynthesis protein